MTSRVAGARAKKLLRYGALSLAIQLACRSPGPGSADAGSAAVEPEPALKAEPHALKEEPRLELLCNAGECAVKLKAPGGAGPLFNVAESELAGHSVKGRDALLWISKRSGADTLTLVVDPKTGKSSGFQQNVCGADGPKNLIAGRKGTLVFVRPLFGAEARQEYHLARKKSAESALDCQFPSEERMKIVYAGENGAKGGVSEAVTLPSPIAPVIPPAGEQEGETKIFSGEKPTKEQIHSAFSGWINFNGDDAQTEYTFDFSNDQAGYAVADMNHVDECSTTYRLQGNRFEYGCALHTDDPEHQACNGKWVEFSFAIEAIYPGGIVLSRYKDSEGGRGRRYIATCRKQSDSDSRPYCGADLERASLELVQGAKDEALYVAVRDRLQGDLPEKGALAAIFEGGKARHPRIESELFYCHASEDHEKLAQALVERLKPIIGPALIKEWPDDSCRNDLILVVGSRPVAEGNEK